MNFADVKPNQKWKPEPAPRYNAVNALLRSLGTLGGKYPGAGSRSTTSVTVFNACKSVIPVFSAVEFSGDIIREGDQIALGVIPHATPGKALALLDDELKMDRIATATLLGIAQARITGKPAAFAEPDPDKGTLKYDASGSVMVLAPDNPAIVMLGGGSGAYSGPFAVSVNESGTFDIAGGLLLRNGEWLNVEPKPNVTMSRGLICLKSTIQDIGGWSEPVYVGIGKTETLRPELVPIAEIDGTSIRQITYGVAVMMVTKRCPMAEF